MNDQLELDQAKFRFRNLTTSMKYCLEHIDEASSRLPREPESQHILLSRISLYSMKVEEFANAAKAQYDIIQEFHRK